MQWIKDDPSGQVGVAVFPVTSKIDERFVFAFIYSAPNAIVEQWLLDGKKECKYDPIHEHLTRLVVFVGLLANDRDLITPFVLAKDRPKYDAMDDGDVRQAIEQRAARRLGRGFDVGRTIQLEKDRTPHWRNPHLALFWTGEGRLKPIIKMRRGAIVHRVSMSEVPTGYLGPEASGDADLMQHKSERVPISTKLRFEVFKRDDYRCRMCGAKACDGAALHVDHRVPVAKGGSNDDDNLWTLCDRCNLGKSDEDL